jgi:hypothetical protein
MSYTRDNEPEIRIRKAGEADLGAVTRVAGRDSGEPLAWPILVATVGEEIRAAISLTDGEIVADPFHRTAELVAMLRIRARGAAYENVVRFERPRRQRIAFRSAA